MLCGCGLQNPFASYAALLSEVKNEFGKTRYPPDLQGNVHYFKFWSYGSATRPARHHSIYYQRSCCPCLMLLVVGNVICIFALAFAERVLCQPLTPYLHIIDLHQHDPLQLESAARALLAMRVVIQQIASFVAPLSKLYSQPAAQHYFKQLAEQVWAGSQTVFGMAPWELVAQQWPWRLQNPALDVQPLMAGKHLYVVRCQQLQPRVFKYMQGYSQEVHQALAACHPPLAPQLHSCIQLPGGWSEVQMELLATSRAGQCYTAGWIVMH